MKFFVLNRPCIGVQLSIYNTTFCLAQWSDIFVLDPRYEKAVTRAIIKILNQLSRRSEGVCFIDVGAHIGRYAILVAKLVRKGFVIAVEPEPNNFRALVCSIRSNKLKNVIAYRVAAHDVSGEMLRLYGHGAASSVAIQWGDRQCLVESVSLDDLLKDLPNYVKLSRHKLIMKIDVEGNELNVIKGAIKTLTNYRPIIICEILSRKNLEYVAKYLRNFEYKMQSLDDRNYLIYPQELEQVKPWWTRLK
ncbi:FkbM family methyltransferase [Thermofilum sp.]|uniref:FkbM family methyltransferase n=1 Tax=Thermofilum sp. TaxID=1961369 RepID=UPI00316967DD